MKSDSRYGINVMCRDDASKIVLNQRELGQIGLCEKRLGTALSTVKTHKDTIELSTSPQTTVVINRSPETEGRHLEKIGTMRQRKKGAKTEMDKP